MNFEHDVIATQLHEASDLLMKLFDNNETEANTWMISDNHLFFGKSPVEMIFNGKGSLVIDTLKEWSETKKH